MSVHKTANQWFELVAAWQSSNLSASQWCRQHGVAYKSFLKWRQRLRHYSPRHMSQTCDAIFRQIPPLPSSALTIEVGSVRLRLERGFDAELLREVVAALQVNANHA